ncbi:MAG: protein-L-isoaspartate O-methyltransferase, partial [Bacteroidetes bacterium]|nr:protein-L-isoaspartate O-methyltransferase [Bacteroidota bacterium]
MNYLICLILSISIFAGSSYSQDDKYTSERETMVKQQIEYRGITDQPTLKAMTAVPRHKFVPPGLIDRAYDDSPFPIGYGQTISQPYIVAYMTAAIDLKSGQKILEIGTG